MGKRFLRDPFTPLSQWAILKNAKRHNVANSLQKRWRRTHPTALNRGRDTGNSAAALKTHPKDPKMKNLPHLFGVANSDHQCEAFYGPWPSDVRDGWERNPRGMATDFCQRYQTDVENAAWLGCKLFRLSICCARVQPAAAFKTQNSAVQHYREVIHSIKRRKMEPMITLLHLAWPTWIQTIGDSPLNGLPSDKFPDLFAEYADEGSRTHFAKSHTGAQSMNQTP
jgi:hypothetical protein